jgi:hypothetical protein
LKLVILQDEVDKMSNNYLFKKKKKKKKKKN